MIDFETMTSAEIAELIKSASAVLQNRLTAAEQASDEHERAQLEAVSKRPTTMEIRHIEDCLRIYKKNGFVYADDLHEYRRIAGKFPEYMKAKRHPMDCRGSEIQRWADKNGI